jgi:hypothetical protein
MGNQPEKPLVQTMDNPIWESVADDIKDKKSKYSLIIKVSVAFISLLLILLTGLFYLSRAGNSSHEALQENESLPAVSPVPTVSEEELLSDYQNGVNEAEKDLESLDLFDESFYPPSIDEAIRL